MAKPGPPSAGPFPFNIGQTGESGKWNQWHWEHAADPGVSAIKLLIQGSRGQQTWFDGVLPMGKGPWTGTFVEIWNAKYDGGKVILDGRYQCHDQNGICSAIIYW